MKPFRIAVIPGDGIGKEVVPEGLRVLEKAAARFGLALAFDHFDFASCDYYLKHGAMLPDDWKERIGRHDAIFYGAVGWPATVPDHISLWGSLIKFRREFDQYVNLRPVRLMPGVPCPLVGRRPGEIDFLVVRENTEGEYSSVGGRMFAGTEREFVVQEAVFTRTGVDRILRFAFELAQSRPKKHLTSCTKSNGISISMPFWDERVAAIAPEYPDVRVNQYHVNILTAHFVRNPDWFDVVVASNLFGDILSDLGPACAGRSASRLGEPQPDAPVPLLVRTGPRQRAGHRRPRRRQPDRPDLVRGDDARLPRPGSRCRHRPPPGGPRRDPPRDRARLRARAADAGHGRHRVDRGGRPGDRGGDLKDRSIR